jgi:DNA-binding transcriptional LysR family regulator
MGLELAQWRAFLAVADRGSLIKAAEVLHTDQPALSRSLRRMERLVGGPLFDRSSKGVTLTDLGTRLLQPVRDLVDQADAVEAQARAEVRNTSGIVRVGSVDVYPISAAIAEASRDFTVSGRSITTEVVSLPWLSHPRALVDRTIDVGFDLTVDDRLLDPKTMRSHALWEETQAFALVSDRHPLAESDVIDPRDLADLPLHLPDKAESPHIYNFILEHLAEAGVPAPRRAAPLSTMATVIAQIAAGDGWLFSARTLARHVPPGLVAKPLAVGFGRKVEFGLIWHINTDAEFVDGFTERLQASLDRRQ